MFAPQLGGSERLFVVLGQAFAVQVAGLHDNLGADLSSRDQVLQKMEDDNYVSAFCILEPSAAGTVEHRPRYWFFHINPGFYNNFWETSITHSDARRMVSEAKDLALWLANNVDFHMTIQGHLLPEDAPHLEVWRRTFIDKLEKKNTLAASPNKPKVQQSTSTHPTAKTKRTATKAAAKSSNKNLKEQHKETESANPKGKAKAKGPKGGTRDDWKIMHKRMFEDAGLDWIDPAEWTPPKYVSNQYYMQLPHRERDLIRYWDHVKPLPPKAPNDPDETLELSHPYDSLIIWLHFASSHRCLLPVNLSGDCIVC